MSAYTIYLPFLAPALLVGACGPSLLHRHSVTAYWFISVVVWVLGSAVLTGLLLLSEYWSDVVAVTPAGFFMRFLATLTVLLLPTALIAILEFALLRNGVGVAMTVVVAALALFASIFALPSLVLFAACTFVDQTCI